MWTSVPTEKTRWPIGLVDRAPELTRETSATCLDGRSRRCRDEGLKGSCAPARVVEHEGARDFDLAHRELVVIASRPVRVGERHRDHGPSSAGRTARCHGEIARRRSPAGEQGPRTTQSRSRGRCTESFVVRLTLGPLVPSARPCRIGEVGAELDEARSELGVENVEVVRPDPALLFLERDEGPAGAALNALPERRPTAISCACTNCDDPEASLVLCAIEMGEHDSSLRSSQRVPVGLREMENRDVVLCGKRRSPRDGIGCQSSRIAPARESGSRGARSRTSRPDREPGGSGRRHSDRAAMQSRSRGDMSLEDVVDVRHVHHARRVSARGLALPARQRQKQITRAGRRPGGGLPPSR